MISSRNRSTHSIAQVRGLAEDKPSFSESTLPIGNLQGFYAASSSLFTPAPQRAQGLLIERHMPGLATLRVPALDGDEPTVEIHRTPTQLENEPVSLTDVASSAGLTRMHFAAQFRAATRLRPHEYLLRRRIERAQEMLVGTGMSVVDVALSVGFQTRSHFTSVFKRYAGQTPRAWRESVRYRSDNNWLLGVSAR
jgi:AraC-like DNA-binding protein